MQTVRRRIITLLSEGPLTIGDLSRMIGVREKEIRAHLPHVKMTVTARRLRFRVDPACCRACGFTFKDRKRLAPPGRCPRCKGTHLQEPMFHILQPKGNDSS